MAEHPHAVLVRKGYECFTSGDMDGLRAMMTSDCTHHVPGSHPLSGDFKGQDAVIGMYRRLMEETNGSMEVDLRCVAVDGRGHAVAMHHITADRQGRHLDDEGAIVFRIVGEKISDLDECVQDLDEANAFWA
ncbi:MULTISPECIES: nuclear transport factor 2 family protein [unclassified Streptomyces]|uniref:nuclear transport factor 2 family protein n=1 Tax=unclassified Streptomyces TaxID=2593676 RepID=UPI00093B65EB|nr:nuclear transport factor 2 family protein [Streptomyces sp. TSRI0107]OKJ90923.1 SnoaL-like polyketide cyclase [Streptomyces sp. TSRI0107]